MKIHIWEAYNPKKISVDVKKEIRDKIKNKISLDIYSFAKKIDITPARLYDYFIYQTTPIPLSVLISLSKLLKISLIQIEQNILMYKQMFVPNKNSIKNPKLPIEITPYFTSIVSNLFFDGSVPINGKGTYYSQKNELIMNDFVGKIKEVFGNVQYSVVRDHRGVLKCRVPRIVGEICKYVYDIKSFGTFDSRISKKIYNLSKEHKIAFILTAILDEGSISYDGQIFFGVNNKLLCEDIKELFSQVEVKTTNVNQKSNSNHYYIYIKSPTKLLRLIEMSNKKYPLISLRYKEEKLKYYFEIKKHPGLRNKQGGDERKRRILISLKNGKKNVNQLSKELLIFPRSIRRHLSVLLKSGEIDKEKLHNEHYFSLTSPH